MKERQERGLLMATLIIKSTGYKDCLSQSKFIFKWFKIQYFCYALHLVNTKCQSCKDFECVEYSDKLRLWSHEVRDLQ